MAQHCVGLKDVQKAMAVVKQYAHWTPILTSTTMDSLSQRQLFFKCENLQKSGSFKIRGALNAVSKLPDATKDVVTHSSGNHGQALALAASLLGKQAHIVMPDNAPVVKRAAVEGYGANVITCESTQQAREATAEATLQAVPNSAYIPPYDYADVIAGQGTTGLEILEQVADLDAIIVPVGGGGLISGIAVAAKGLNPNIKIIAAEPEQASDCARSKAAGEHILLDAYPSTVADGLRTSMGKLNWPIIHDLVDTVITISEKDIIKAMRLVLERMKIVIEPSAGVPAGVAISDEFKKYSAKIQAETGKGLDRVAVVLCGGNQDLDRLPWVVDPQWDQQ
eukprot:m.348929 g.348929  ORF g.348929 m.348929 type:complete len:337 (-) comp16148_c3_seq1:187-1197(-)